LVRGLTPVQLGLVSQNRSELILGSLLGAALLGGFHWLRLWRVGKLEGPAPDFMRKLAGLILPTTLVELLPYFALAITAGVCEEFLYRGFAIAALAHVGLAKWAVVIVSSILFGLAHAYQGRGGILTTMVMGILFAVARLGYDSLLPVMVWHATVDVVAGIAGPTYLLRGKGTR
jgi:membrane protease YdiL (CAAX protease family)